MIILQKIYRSVIYIWEFMIIMYLDRYCTYIVNIYLFFSGEQHIYTITSLLFVLMFQVKVWMSEYWDIYQKEIKKHCRCRCHVLKGFAARVYDQLLKQAYFFTLSGIKHTKQTSTQNNKCKYFLINVEYAHHIGLMDEWMNEWTVRVLIV